MKRLITLMLLPLCLLGCASSSYPADAANHPEYSYITDTEKEMLCERFNELEAQTYDDDNAEAMAALKKEAEGLEDITKDIIYSGFSEDVHIYAITEDRSALLVENNGRFGTVCSTYLETAEYQNFTSVLCKKSGLTYYGAILGGENERYTSFDDEGTYHYTGRNSIDLVNPEYLLYGQIASDSHERVFNDLPMHVVLYMDGDKVSFIQIYWLYGELAPVMTENGLKSLYLTDETGKTAAELARELFGGKKKISGERNGIKYSYIPDIAQNLNDDTKCAMLELDME